MAQNNPPSPPSLSKPPPTTTLLSQTPIYNLCPAASPGPMTLVSSFFAENDPDNDCRSFSQLLAGGMSSPSVSNFVRNVELPPDIKDESGGNEDFRFRQNWIAGVADSQSQGMFTIPDCFLSSAAMFSSPQGLMPSEQIIAQVPHQAQAQFQRQIESKFPSLSATSTSSIPPMQPCPSNASSHQQIPPPLQIMESASISGHKPQPPNFSVDKPTEDGYNWRKYGQKQVKGSEYPRSYYKCTHMNCPVKKIVERSLNGQITEIIYKGHHNHSPPSKRTRDSGNPNGTTNVHAQGKSEFENQTGNANKVFSSVKDQESSQVTPEHMSGSSDSEEVGNVETRTHERDEDEPEAKRRNVEVQSSETMLNHRSVTEPRIVVQTTSEVDLLDDGYRWRKYGQKVVKGNPHPRSYYKCTHPGCNVRKHVERAASDPKAVITTYEGKHNHGIPAARASSHSTVNAFSVSRPQVPS